MSVKITRGARIASIQLPIEFKDVFKALFPRARWNPDFKVWEVPSGAAARLEEFAAEIGGAVAAMNAAHAAMDAQPLSAGEREMLNRSIEIVTAAARQIEEQKRANLTAAADDSARVASLEALLSSVVNIGELKRVASGMHVLMNPADRVKKMRFEESRLKFKTAREALAAAGLRCQAVSFLASANVNRPDRDSPNCMPLGAWTNIARIEQDELNQTVK